jgi:hypothetical protein
MNVFEELRIRVKYRDEMEIWGYEIRMNILDLLERRFLREGIWRSEFKEIHDAVFPSRMSDRIIKLYDRRMDLKKLLEQ